MRTQMTDTGQFGLRGPVRVCETEREYVYPDRQWVMHPSTIFSTGGKPAAYSNRKSLGPRTCHWTTWTSSWKCRDSSLASARDRKSTRLNSSHANISYA